METNCKHQTLLTLKLPEAKVDDFLTDKNITDNNKKL